MRSLGDVGAGSTLGRYELLLPIAQGGMAMVWAARMKGTRGFQKIVALKSMLPALSEDPQFEAMFLAEAELASQIRHPNVCEILDLGEDEGVLYLVMEWVDGEPLSVIQKASRAHGGMPMSVPARIGYHAALGLHAAHELKNEAGDLVGLVHRDVSPQNILVTYEGLVKIVDFGVAKAAEQEQGQTQAGQLKGKIGFMSPEQALGQSVDRRTDIFALGIVLYQAIAGKHPFRGENNMATLTRICDSAPVPPLSTVIPGCPCALSAAVSKALEKDASKRFQTMVEFARALEGALAELAAGGDEQDLGGFVRSVLADKAERRRAAIKESLRLADEQTERRKSMPTPMSSQPTWGGTDPGHRPGFGSPSAPGSMPGSTPGSTPPTTGVTNVTTVLGMLSQSQPGFTGPEVADPSGAALMPVHAPSSSKKTLLAAVALVAVGIGVGALLFARRGGDPVVANHTIAALPTDTSAATMVIPAPSSAPSSVPSSAPVPSATAEPTASASSSAKPLAGAPQVAARPRTPGTVPASKTTSKTATTRPHVPQIRNPGF
jgi:serine/threonine-protein kinase